MPIRTAPASRGPVFSAKPGVGSSCSVMAPPSVSPRVATLAGRCFRGHHPDRVIAVPVVWAALTRTTFWPALTDIEPAISHPCQGMRPARPAGDSGTVNEHYDVIIVGSGAGGGTLAHTLAGSGKSILLLERGDFLTRETDNWDPKPVFVDGKYISKDTWYDGEGKPFQPQVHYFVGGATKLYGAALYRLRPQDFGEIRHVDGISPAWPLSYDDFEPWYSAAEQLYQVHGV